MQSPSRAATTDPTPRLRPPEPPNEASGILWPPALWPVCPLCLDSKCAGACLVLKGHRKLARGKRRAALGYAPSTSCTAKGVPETGLEFIRIQNIPNTRKAKFYIVGGNESLIFPRLPCEHGQSWPGWATGIFTGNQNL